MAILGVAGLGLTGCSDSATKDLSGTITAAGSTALQPLAEAAADLFKKKHPNVQITVQGGGSTEGLQKVADGSVQIGDSDLFAEHLLSDSDAAKLVDTKVAVVSMGPVAHLGVGVQSLSLDQLKGIFTGKVTNWKEVGGKDLKIVVINRASGSGTRATFEAAVLGGESAPDDFKPQEVESSDDVVKAIKETEGTISYLAFSYYDEERFTCLQIDGTAPTANNVVANYWPIWTYEHMYVAQDADETTKAFVAFVASDEVRDAVTEHGYIRIGDMKVEKDSDGNVKQL